MSEEQPKNDRKDLSEWEPVHDSVGVTHWLPPMRCRNCDD